MSITHTNRDKFLGTISPADVPLEVLPVVELTANELRRIDELAQRRCKSYTPIDGGVIFTGSNSSASSLSRHVIGLLGECAVAKFYSLSVDSDVYQFGDDGIDLELYGESIDVKTTATTALDLPELLVRADKTLQSDIYVRAHVIDWDETGARVRIIGAASQEVVKNREPQRHPGSTKNYVVTPRELDLLPALRTN
jgi:hypothetical protein